MTGRIYLVEKDGTLRSLEEQIYNSEDMIQTLLEKYPDLLAGEQIDESSPRRWLLVSGKLEFLTRGEGLFDGPSTTCSWIKMEYPHWLR